MHFQSLALLKQARLNIKTIALNLGKQNVSEFCNNFTLITRYRASCCENYNISVNNGKYRVGFQPCDYCLRRVRAQRLEPEEAPWCPPRKEKVSYRRIACEQALCLGKKIASSLVPRSTKNLFTG